MHYQDLGATADLKDRTSVQSPKSRPILYPSQSLPYPEPAVEKHYCSEYRKYRTSGKQGDILEFRFTFGHLPISQASLYGANIRETNLNDSLSLNSLDSRGFKE